MGLLPSETREVAGPWVAQTSYLFLAPHYVCPRRSYTPSIDTSRTRSLSGEPRTVHRLLDFVCQIVGQLKRFFIVLLTRPHEARNTLYPRPHALITSSLLWLNPGQFVFSNGGPFWFQVNSAGQSFWQRDSLLLLNHLGIRTVLDTVRTLHVLQIHIRHRANNKVDRWSILNGWTARTSPAWFSQAPPAPRKKPSWSLNKVWKLYFPTPGID